MKTVMKHSAVFLNDDKKNHDMLVELNLIINCATIAGNIDRFRILLDETKKEFRYFNIYISESEVHIFQRNLKTKADTIYVNNVDIDDTQLIMHVKY